MDPTPATPPERFALDLDLRGMPCPLPMLTLHRRLPEAPVGGLVRLRTDSAAAVTDLPAWSRATGNEIVESEQDGDDFLFVVRRVG